MHENLIIAMVCGIQCYLYLSVAKSTIIFLTVLIQILFLFKSMFSLIISGFISLFFDLFFIVAALV
jgi:hypothetical protein